MIQIEAKDEEMNPETEIQEKLAVVKDPADEEELVASKKPELEEVNG